MGSSPVDPEQAVAHPANNVGYGFKPAFKVIHKPLIGLYRNEITLDFDISLLA
jgi:hypothetical protein